MPTVRTKGFTLIEVMIVVVIVGIIAAVALPSYRQYVIRGNRVAAQSQMMDIANIEQQYLLANRTYGTKAELGYSLSGKVGTFYTYDIDVDNAATPPIFTINFTAIGSQTSDGNLSLNSAGVKTPSSKW